MAVGAALWEVLVVVAAAFAPVLWGPAVVEAAEEAALLVPVGMSALLAFRVPHLLSMSSLHPSWPVALFWLAIMHSLADSWHVF